MNFSDQEATRLREAFASLSQGAEGRPDCPEPERLWQAANGDLPAAEIQSLVDHTAGCASCAEDWRMAHELAPKAEPTVAAFPTKRPQPRPTWWLAAAAALLLALVSAPLWRASTPVDSPETVRTPGDSVAILSLIPDDGVLSRDDCVLRWSSGPAPVVAYKLLVSTESFEVLTRQEGLEEPTYRVPSEVLRQVPAGGKILWQVEAVGPADRRFLSPTFIHRLE